MAGAMPLAGQTLSQLTNASQLADALLIAKEAWAEKAKCDHIDREGTSEFFRIWLGCALYGICLTTLITVPYFVCSGRRSKEFEDDDQLELPAANKTHKEINWASLQKLRTQNLTTELNWDAAKEHLKRTSPVDNEGQWRSLWFTSASNMSEIGGIGLELYFKLLRVLGLCFTYKTIFSLPLLVFAVQGDFAPDFGNRFVKSTAGNLGNLATGSLSQADRHVIVGCQSMELKKLTPLFAWLDVGGTIMLTLYLVYFRFYVLSKLAKVDDRENITCRDYGLQIEDLPRTIPLQDKYEEALAAHLTDRINDARKLDHRKSIADAGISEVYLVRDYDRQLSAVKYRNALMEKKMIAEDKGEELHIARFCGCCSKRSVQWHIAQQDRILKKELLPEPQLPVVRAYVICNVAADAGRLRMHYRFANYRLFKCCQSGALRFDGNAIRVLKAPEPTNLIWENQDVSWKRRAVLKALMFVLWLVIIVIAIVLVFGVQKAAMETGTKASTQVVGEASCDAGTQIPADAYQCDAVEAADWTYEMALNFTNADETACFCVTQGYAAIVQDELLWKGICKQWVIDASASIGIMTASSLCTVVINAILLALVKWMVSRELHPSVSAMNNSLMFKICWSQFGNISLIVFLLHYYSEPLNFIFNGQYSDFERGWYATVGATLVTNMMFNSITNPILYIVFYWLSKITRCCCTRGIGHQVELLTAYENPPFDLAARYAGILVTVLATMTYSAGIPLLNFFALLYFFFTFWTDKIVLLWGSKRPPAYDTQMPKECCQWMLVSLPIHVFVAMFMFSHSCTFPSDPIGGELQVIADNTKGNFELGEDSNAISERISRQSSWMFFVVGCFIIFLFVLFVIWKMASETVGTCLALTRDALCPKRAQTAPEGTQEYTFDQAIPHIESVRPPASYRMDRSAGGVSLDTTLRGSLKVKYDARDGPAPQPDCD